MIISDLTPQQVFDALVAEIRAGRDPARIFCAYNEETVGMSYDQLAGEGRTPPDYVGLVTAVERVYDQHIDYEPALRTYARSHGLTL